jgi:N-ethylmaleimide reductase
MKLFSTYYLGNIQLKNRIVMAPMTRSRAINNIPHDLIAKYYEQRADAGLIITEGTAPSPNGLGYPRIPGIFNQEQIDGWKKVTDAVHRKNGKIFVQLMHTGRVSHIDNMPEGTKIIAPSPVKLEGEMYTDKNGMQAYPVPKEMTLEEIEHAQNEYVQAAKNAIEAGFDGVELHGANGYLIDQFINPTTNKRNDDFGGSIENRSRFAIEIAKKVSAEIGSEKTGIRFSPYGAASGMGIFDGLEDTYEYLAKKLGELKLAYIHIVDHSSMGAPKVTDSVKEKIRNAFGGTIILSGGYDKERAEKDLNENKGELVAFGKPFISNPDFVERIKKDAELSSPDFSTFYTPGEKGYTDYSLMNKSQLSYS